MVLAKGARVALAAGVCAIIGLAAPALADTMVVRASGPSARAYPPGSKLADGGSLSLKAGDVVTLLDARGTRTLRGPGSFKAASSATAAPTSSVTLSALLDTKRVRRARTGAVRGNVSDTQATPKRPNLWLVDVAQPGTLCFADPAAVRLWRADAARATSVKISGGAKQAVANFAAGEPIAAWPAALPVTDGASYRIEGTDIRFAAVGPVEQGLEKVAGSLIAKGCEAQLNLLVDATARK